MRTAHLKLPQDALFIPGWLVAVVGGHVLLLLLLFVLAAPSRRPYVAAADLPTATSVVPTEMRHALVTALVTRHGTWAVSDRWVDGIELAEAFELFLGAERPGILVRAHADAPWTSIRHGIRAADAAGALRIEFEVLDEAGRVGSIALDVDAPLPELPDSARAQDLIDHLLAKPR